MKGERIVYQDLATGAAETIKAFLEALRVQTISEQAPKRAELQPE